MAAFPVSETTQKILKNFSSISNSVLLLEGQHQKTVTQSKAVFALAEFPEAWPKETGIYDLSMFLSTLSLFDKPTLDFKDDAMVVTNADKVSLSVRYRYSDPSTIMEIGNKTFPKDEPAVEFTLTDYALSQLKKTAALLKLASINITAKEGVVFITANDPKNSSSHAFRLDIPKSEAVFHDPKFSRTVPFKVEHFALVLDGNYSVGLSSWQYAYMTNKAVPLFYYVTEQNKD